MLTGFWTAGVCSPFPYFHLHLTPTQKYINFSSLVLKINLLVAYRGSLVFRMQRQDDHQNLSEKDTDRPMDRQSDRQTHTHILNSWNYFEHSLENVILLHCSSSSLKLPLIKKRERPMHEDITTNSNNSDNTGITPCVLIFRNQFSVCGLYFSILNALCKFSI